ncbi:Transcriptional regulatory protein ZraR [Fundidesulfovibrio magnetotacticus]|uniref:Transcriptional regulatory protein ZraR n=1 Tax=Fundidesulfovibrio magnetotacticus TaxID=2730080 RepID=A0A6V8LS92_9BACT|nr:sigma-54 dependent transcriptional regulator [Fundidesulfovibrio magnetotacticus]GFK92477.1 Transcriptional regulatory protein ZraR [Fundidesulfovibrio magnetotacticus]
MASKDRKTILVADDDPHIQEVLDVRLSSAGYEVILAADGREALAELSRRPVDLVISDVRMPGLDGLELQARLEKIAPRLPIIFLTAFGSIQDAVTAIKSGAVDYLTKPFEGRELLDKVKQVLDRHGQGQAASPAAGDGGMWRTASQRMRDLAQVVEKVAPRDVNVLLLGESGTGKERIAHLIHELSPRREHPLVVVDCGSTPASLLESELFGHVKGSFTHAVKDKKGLIEEAHKGTLFLDEIGNISQEMQVRLLRFLENRKIRRIGDTREIAVDCRVVAATNADLAQDVARGDFREDLYYRLRVVTIQVPPLRDRREDIPILAEHFAKSFCKAQGMPPVAIPRETAEFMLAYAWPGNIRELKNAVEAGIVLCQGGVLTPADLQVSPAGKPRHGESEALSLDESEKQAIVKALEKSNWVQKDAAPLLGVSRRALNYKIQKYGIDIPTRRRVIKP